MNGTKWILFSLLAFKCWHYIKMTTLPKFVILGIYSLSPANWRFSSNFYFTIPKSWDDGFQLTAVISEIMKVICQEKNTLQSRKGSLFVYIMWQDLCQFLLLRQYIQCFNNHRKKSFNEMIKKKDMKSFLKSHLKLLKYKFPIRVVMSSACLDHHLLA